MQACRIILSLPTTTAHDDKRCPGLQVQVKTIHKSYKEDLTNYTNEPAIQAQETYAIINHLFRVVYEDDWP